jgi:hypothetical protein
MLPRDKLLTRPCLITSQNELCTNYKQNIKVAVPSRFNPMSKALRLHSLGPGYSTLSTARGSHLLLLDPIPQPSPCWGKDNKWEITRQNGAQNNCGYTQVILTNLISWGVINIHWDPCATAKSTRVSKLILRLTASCQIHMPPVTKFVLLLDGQR